MYYNFLNASRNLYFIERALGDAGELGTSTKPLADVKKVLAIMS